jgi:RNAse (barnase) inhibitor barstar
MERRCFNGKKKSKDRDLTDTFWDCLSTNFSPKKIVIYNTVKLIENMGSYGDLIINLFQEVARENEYIEVIIQRQTDASSQFPDKEY